MLAELRKKLESDIGAVMATRDIMAEAGHLTESVDVVIEDLKTRLNQTTGYFVPKDGSNATLIKMANETGCRVVKYGKLAYFIEDISQNSLLPWCRCTSIPVYEVVGDEIKIVKTISVYPEHLSSGLWNAAGQSMSVKEVAECLSPEDVMFLRYWHHTWEFMIDKGRMSGSFIQQWKLDGQEFVDRLNAKQSDIKFTLQVEDIGSPDFN